VETKCPEITLWRDVRNIFFLDVRRFVKVSLRYYVAYGASAILFLMAVYLTLPLLRDAGAQSVLMVFYEFPLPGGRRASFSLPWAVPLLAVIFAIWCLAISKRIEYCILRVGHNVVQVTTDVLLAGKTPEGRGIRNIEALGRTTGMALRHLALLVLKIVQLAIIFLLLLVMEPLVLLVVFFVVLALTLFFWSAIWPSQSEDRVALADLGPLISHRLRMSNAQQVYAALMPITILIVLAVSRVADLFYFDLAGLLFLSLLISFFGSALAEVFQSLLRLNQRFDLHKKMLEALCMSDSEQFESLLAMKKTTGGECEDSSLSG